MAAIEGIISYLEEDKKAECASARDADAGRRDNLLTWNASEGLRVVLITTSLLISRSGVVCTD